MNFFKTHFVKMLVLILFATSCFERSFTPKQIWDISFNYDPGIQLILPDKDYPAVDCNFYGPGCINGRYVRIRGIVMHFIQYENEEYARRSATRFNTFYKYNWLFEDIQNEPILQDFVKEHFGAKRPPPPIRKKEEEIKKKKEITIDLNYDE